MIVGLLKEVEYKAGTLWPAERRVIEMPRAVNEGPRPFASRACLSGIPLQESRSGGRYPPGRQQRELRIGRTLLGGVALGIVGMRAGGEPVSRRECSGTRLYTLPVMQSDLGLGALDDYDAVVRRLGKPVEDRWRPDRGEMQYRLLGYPQQGFYVILMGRDRAHARYIGAIDRRWKPVHAVDLAGGMNSGPLLRALKRF